MLRIAVWDIKCIAMLQIARLRALQAEAAVRSCEGEDEPKLSGRAMVKKRGQQAEGAKGPSSLFLLSDDNLIRRYTKFIIEWPYPFFAFCLFSCFCSRDDL
ncbi:hypothetical protein CDAR_438831 [Caerostris darwini]|uniref:Uncharacterized protein n=1 Tax=Caerostris darwini TaxID=1538125 RepID=A0AAV4X0X5_9ARAC|nr:hypothetical protein CDAR_438831 [Caerostris darwini]